MAKLTISETFARKVVKYLRFGAKTVGYLSEEEVEDSLEMAHRLERRLDNLEKRLRSKGDRE